MEGLRFRRKDTQWRQCAPVENFDATKGYLSSEAIKKTRPSGQPQLLTKRVIAEITVIPTLEKYEYYKI